MKKLFARSTAVVLSLALLLTSCGGGATATSMHLKKTEGTVAVSDSEGKTVSPRKDLGLYSGYGVETQAKSYAWIDLDKVKLTKLDAESQIEIGKEGKNLEIDVISGELFFNVTEPLDDDETMDIVTSTMIVGIRGTCGWVGEDTAALLEGTVSVTAGDQEVTVNAGEMAVLTADGTLEVKPFTVNDVPAFVVEEISDDSDLAQAVLDATGLNIPAYSMASYEELLSTLENVVYSELIDFEQDGSPELLVISLDFSRKSATDVGVDYIGIYRNGLDGTQYLVRVGSNMHGRGNYSLVESNGKLFVRRYAESESGHGAFIEYFGSTVQSDGGNESWGIADNLQVSFKADGSLDHFWVRGPEGHYGMSSGVVSEYEAIVNKYIKVRDLVIYEGENVTIVEP